MSDVTKTSSGSEQGHWYRRTADGVEQIDEVKGVNGKLRKPTLRDAKKHGDWLCGVTTVVRQAAADALTRWRIREHVRAAVELGGPRVRVEEDGHARVEDWSQFNRVVAQRADEIAAQARDLGSLAHEMVHLRITNPKRLRERQESATHDEAKAIAMQDGIMETLWEFCADWDHRVGAICEHHAATDHDGSPLVRPEIPYESEMPVWWQALDQEERELTYFGGDVCGQGGSWDWRSEDPVCHPLGFATRADLWTPLGGGWLFDFKGKPSRDKLTVTTYEQHHMQLAATRAAIEHTHGVHIPSSNCRIIYFSREPSYGEKHHAKVADGCAQLIDNGWDMFRGLLLYWISKNNYNPGWTSLVQSTTEGQTDE